MYVDKTLSGGSPPLAVGNTLVTPTVSVTALGSPPTRVGNTLGGARPVSPPPVHPHSRGEYTY